MAEQLGEVFAGRWEVTAVIGRGGMATVYQAHDGDEVVAVKCMLRAVADNAGLRERFFSEARLLQRLEHRNVVRAFEAGQTDEGVPFVVMERLHGVPLDTLLTNKGGRLDIDECLLIAEQVLSLLQLCHDQGVIHRDLKPANIFVTREGVIKVLDFGVARVEGESDPAVDANKRLGTPAYMSPEQAINAATGIDRRSDIFALGATLYSLLSGVRLRDTQSSDEAFILAATTPPQSLARAAPDLPLSIIRLVDRSLAWNPVDRFQTAAEMSAEINQVLADLQDEPSSQGAGRRELAAALGALVSREEDALAPEVRREKHRDTKELFRLCASVFGARFQFDWDHQQVQAKRSAAFQHLATALKQWAEGVAWTLRPYGFDYDGEPVWEPVAGQEDIPYNLFASGFRTLRFLPGITAAEFDRFLRLMALDPARDLPDDDDLATVYVEQEFPNVDAKLVQSFDMSLLHDHLHMHTELADLRQEIRDQLSEDYSERAEVAGLIAEIGEAGLKEADAIAISFQRGAVEQLAANQATTIPESIFGRYRVLFEQEAERSDDRVHLVLATALHDALASQELELVASPLRELLSQRAAEKGADDVYHLLDSIAAELPPAERQLIFERTVDSDTAARLLERAVEDKGQPPDKAFGCRPMFVEIIVALNPRCYGTVFDAFGRSRGTPTGDILRQYVERHVAGNEEILGNALAGADLELGEDLVAMLKEPETSGAHAALQQASKSGFKTLRLDALSVNIHQPSEPVLSEVTALLQDDDPEVRAGVLRMLSDHDVQVAVPKIVGLLRDSSLHDRPLRERQMMLTFVFEHSLRDAVTVAGELARKHGLFCDKRVDATRRLAVDFLGEYAASEEALESVRAAKSRGWWNSKNLRDAATRAETAIQGRIKQGGT